MAYGQPLDSSNVFVFSEFKEVKDGFHKEKLWVLEDKTGNLTLEDIIRLERSDSSKQLFKPLHTWYDSLNGEYVFDHRYVYWGKVVLFSQNDRHTDWMYYVGFNNHIELYQETPVANTFIKRLGGQYVPASQKDVAEGRVSPFRISLPPKQAVTLYIRTYNFNKRPVDFYLALVKPTYWYELLQRRNLIEGLFDGVLLVMFFYNFFLFLSNRDRTYLYYALYIFHVTVYFFVIKGFSKEYLLGEYPRLEPHVWSMALGLSPVFYFQFIRHYLHTWELIPKWDKWMKMASWVAIAIVTVENVILYVSFDVWLVGYLSVFSLIVASIFSTILIVKLLKTKEKLAYYLIAGSICLWVGSLVGLGFTAAQYFGNGLYWGQTGIIAEVLIFSLGLGYRMRRMQHEKQEVQTQLIHQLKQNEQLQAEANRKLEEKVKQRTQEIEAINARLKEQNEKIEAQKESIAKQNEELARTNQRLIELNEEKNHLIGIVAHDLRNPLTSALSMANLLQHETAELLDDDQRECLTVIISSLYRMNTMIERILDVNVIEGKKIELNFVESEVACLVSKVVDSLQKRAMQKNIMIHTHLHPIRLKVDETYFVQAFENVLSNAIKFSPLNAKVVVTARPSNDYYQLSITDEGPGLTEDDKKRLFHKYQKLSAQPTAGEKSTGLGLSIAKKYVEAMGGKIWCESEYGKGATFFLAFPLQTAM